MTSLIEKGHNFCRAIENSLKTCAKAIVICNVAKGIETEHRVGLRAGDARKHFVLMVKHAQSGKSIAVVKLAASKDTQKSRFS